MLSLFNFITIQYKLVVETVPFLSSIFSHLIYFAVVFILTYIPLAVFIGWYDYRRFAMPVELTLRARTNPWTRDLARALICLAEGKNEEAVEILKKWTEALK